VVRIAPNCETATKALEDGAVDLVLLDLMLPDGHGLDLLRWLRDDLGSALPVVVLTAFRQEEKALRAFELGAADFISKPFRPRELVARIQAVVRRTSPAHRPGLIERGDVRIDLAARRVWRGAKEVRLTPIEFNLLVELAAHAGDAVSHESLLTKVWGPEYRTEGHYLKVYVGRLRDKLEREPASPRLIETVRGVGYRFAAAKE
jgi:two-component system KDP operon response regulator KdpE